MGDGDLLRAGRAGDHAALEALLARHQRPLYAFCRGVLRHREDAEDAVQETFLRALRGLQGLRSDASVRAWLTRIALNVCLEWKRSRNRGDAQLPDGEDHWAGESSPEGEALVHLYVTEALSVLHPRQRAVLLLKVLEEWTAAEIAAAMRCTQWQVYHEIRSAHHALAEWRRRSAKAGE